MWEIPNASPIVCQNWSRRRPSTFRGEKDVHTLEKWGPVASCNPGGRPVASTTQVSCAAYLPLPSVRIPDKRQISRGKFDRLPHATAEFTTSAFDGYGLRDHMPARPAPYTLVPVLVHRLVRLLHASFRSSLRMTPLRFAMTSRPSGFQKDFHLRA